VTPWFAVHTHAQGENKAAFHLRRQGYTVYLPQYLKRRNHARKVDWLPSPLFPRYLFVNFGDTAGRWRPINSTIGVSHIVCQGTSPMEVPGAIVDNIRACENDKNLVNLNTADSFKIGDKVLVNAGPFDEHVGLFQGHDDKQRVTLLLTRRGRDVLGRVNAELIDKAD
jgi:transcriptional antiterminator RfaH